MPDRADMNEFDFDAYGLKVSGSSPSTSISHIGTKNCILLSTTQDCEVALGLLEEEFERMKAEIIEDFALGYIRDTEDALADVEKTGNLADWCDSNIYLSGGRVADGDHYEWSDEKNDDHIRKLNSHRVLGKGVGPIKINHFMESEAYCGFISALSSRTTAWLVEPGALRSAIDDYRATMSTGMRP